MTSSSWHEYPDKSVSGAKEAACFGGDPKDGPDFLKKCITDSHLQVPYVCCIQRLTCPAC